MSPLWGFFIDALFFIASPVGFSANSQARHWGVCHAPLRSARHDGWYANIFPQTPKGVPRTPREPR